MNVISGDNGQGKTNLLEAVFFLAMGRSFRTTRNERLVRRGETTLRVAGRIESGGVHHRLEAVAGGGRRERLLDGKAADLEATLGVFSSLAFASARMEVIRGGPDDRRRFLNRGMVAARPELLAPLREHARALRQKNELLRRGREGQAASLGQQVEAFNDRLAATGTRIRRARSLYVQQLSGILETHDGVARVVPGGVPRLAYRPSPALDINESEATEGDIEAAVRKALQGRLAEEMRRGHSLAGCQRDNLAITLAGLDLSAFGSSGQQRATLIALKIAKMLVHKELRNEYPVLLVDDVDSELDATRTQRALELLDGPFQVLVASAQADRWAAERSVARHHQLQNGIISTL